MKEELEFFDVKTRTKFKSKEWRIETKEAEGRTRYFAVTKVPQSTHETWRQVSATFAKPLTKTSSLRASDAYQYATLIGVQARTLGSLIQKVENGLPYTAFERLVKLLNSSASEVADLLRIPHRTLNRRKKSGFLTHEESERILRMSRIVNAAFNLYEGRQESAISWLRKENRALGGETPLSMSGTEIGSEEVLNLIGRLEHGVFS
jgi:putative toxin-antitoxin system antitoxin component (TIGR02293 family)